MVRGRGWREVIVKSDPFGRGRISFESFTQPPLTDIFVHGNEGVNRLTMSTESVKLWQ